MSIIEKIKKFFGFDNETVEDVIATTEEKVVPQGGIGGLSVAVADIPPDLDKGLVVEYLDSIAKLEADYQPLMNDDTLPCECDPV